jgi:uncharacterized protein DUF6934
VKYEFYAAVRTADDLSTLDFVSTGKSGNFRKRVVFMRTEIEGVYNLAFGDVTENGEIDDYSITDNGDRNKILATVFDVVNTYTVRYPEHMIYFRGSTKERTRLYRIAIGLNFEELSQVFDIYVEIEGDNRVIPFRKNLEVEAFLVKRKSLKQSI